MRRSNLIVAEILEAIEIRGAARGDDPGAGRNGDGASGEERRLAPLSRDTTDIRRLCAPRSTKKSFTAFPPARVLKEGDIVSLDFGVICEDYYGDAAITLPIGRVSPEAEELLRVTRRGPVSGD